MLELDNVYFKGAMAKEHEEEICWRHKRHLDTKVAGVQAKIASS